MKKIVKNNQGFTLLELLVVIAIIAILSAVVIVTLNDSRTKSKIAAFKTETSGVQPLLVTSCDGAEEALTVPSDTDNTNYDSFTDDCSNGDGTFSLTATPVDTSISCIATIDENGASFSGC